MTETLFNLLQKITADIATVQTEVAILCGYISAGDFNAQSNKENNSYALTTPKEEPMEIKLKGVSINSKPRADGRFQGYVMHSGKRQYFYAETYQAVAEKVRQFIQEGQCSQNKRTKKKINSPTFGEFLSIWLEIYKKPNLKITSFSSIVSVLKPAVNLFNDRLLCSISSEDVQKLLLSIKATRVRGLCLMHLNALFQKAKLKGIIKRNPCEAVEIKRHKSKHVKSLTLDETKIFLDLTFNSPYFLLYRFLISTGLRIGEALALQRSDIDFIKGTVSISKNVVFIKGKRIEQSTPKTEAGNRIVPISMQMCDELAELKTDLLFPYTYNSIRCALSRIDKKVDFHVTLHILRHTYATRLEEAGISPKVKQYLLGHASLEMTQNKYTDIQIQYLETISDSIRKLF